MNYSKVVWPMLNVISKDVLSGKTSAVDQVRKSLDRIAEVDPEYNCIITILKDQALNRAKYIDAQIKKGLNPGRLAGVPFIAKDNFMVDGAETTAASKMLKGFQSPYQATAIERLEAQGAICVAKANMDAFAHGGSTENSDFKITKNPYDTSRVAGGSSGGSAASVALGMVPFALGTDTGGSIRQPASFCGVVGYKPTYGLVSRSGVVAMASSTDTIGVLARSTEDATIIVDTMRGKDSLDGTTIDLPGDLSLGTDFSLKGKKIGIITEFFSDGLQSGVSKTIKTAISKLELAGAIVSEVSLPSVSLALAVYYIVVPAEISSNLARHDGQRYQYSAKNITSLEDAYTKSRSQGFGAEAKRRIMIGAHVLSSGYYDAYYNKAQTVRTKIIAEFEQAFNAFDFLVGPVAPTIAFRIGENSEDPLTMYLQDIYSVPASLVGMPAISIPCGFYNKMPVGLQLIAPVRGDAELLAAAKIFEEII